MDEDGTVGLADGPQRRDDRVGAAVEVAEVVLRPVRVVPLFAAVLTTGGRAFAAVPTVRSLSQGSFRSPAGMPVSAVSSV